MYTIGHAYVHQDLATLTGTSQSAIAAYEGERKSPTWCTVERLAKAAGLEIDLRFIPPLTREERRSLLLHEAVSARLREEPEAVLVRARAHARAVGDHAVYSTEPNLNSHAQAVEFRRHFARRSMRCFSAGTGTSAKG